VRDLDQAIVEETHRAVTPHSEHPPPVDLTRGDETRKRIEDVGHLNRELHAFTLGRLLKASDRQIDATSRESGRRRPSTRTGAGGG
jgi:hypothetical protein